MGDVFGATGGTFGGSSVHSVRISCATRLEDLAAGLAAIIDFIRESERASDGSGQFLATKRNTQ